MLCGGIAAGLGSPTALAAKAAGGQLKARTHVPVELGSSHRRSGAAGGQRAGTQQDAGLGSPHRFLALPQAAAAGWPIKAPHAQRFNQAM